MKVNVFYRHVRCRNIEQRRKGRAFQHGPLLPNQGQRLIDNNGVGFGLLCIDSGCKMDDVSGTGLRHCFRQAGCTVGLHHDFIRPCRRAADSQQQHKKYSHKIFHHVFSFKISVTKRALCRALPNFPQARFVMRKTSCHTWLSGPSWKEGEPAFCLCLFMPSVQHDIIRHILSPNSCSMASLASTAMAFPAVPSQTFLQHFGEQGSIR